MLLLLITICQENIANKSSAQPHSVSQHTYYVLKSLYTVFALSAVDFDQAAVQLYRSYSAQEIDDAKGFFALIHHYFVVPPQT